MHPQILKYLTIIAFLFTIASDCSFAQSQTLVKITGNIKGLNNDEFVTLLIYDSKKQDWIAIDTVVAKNGLFCFNKHLPEGPRWCWIRFSNGRIIRAVFDNLEHVNIQAKSDQEDLVHKYPHSVLDDAVTITGSSTNDDWKKNRLILESYADDYHIWEGNMQKVKDSVGFEPIIVGKLVESKNKINQDFAAKLKNITRKNLIPLYIDVYNAFARSHSGDIRNVFLSLNEQDKDNHHGKCLTDSFLSHNLAIGDILDYFELPDTGQKMISLQNVTNKSKVTLIHFWANKSAYRAELDKNLFSMYKLYHDKGLNIIGVSADKYFEEWKEALNIQKYPWINVIDKGGKLTTNVYKEGGHRVPNTTDVLLNAEGKIITWDPSPLELQYYLWKSLSQ